jgi:hypothetical protein
MREVAVGTVHGERKKGKEEEEGEGPGAALSDKLYRELQAALRNGRH